MGKNLFDKSAATVGFYINEQGVYTADGTSEYSALIPVTSERSYTFSGINKRANIKRIHGYDSSGTWVRQVGFEYFTAVNTSFAMTVTIPTDVRYIRISHYTVDEYAQFELGSQANEYEPYDDGGCFHD